MFRKTINIFTYAFIAFLVSRCGNFEVADGLENSLATSANLSSDNGISPFTRLGLGVQSGVVESGEFSGVINPFVERSEVNSSSSRYTLNWQLPQGIDIAAIELAFINANPRFILQGNRAEFDENLSFFENIFSEEATLRLANDATQFTAENVDIVGAIAFIRIESTDGRKSDIIEVGDPGQVVGFYNPSRQLFGPFVDRPFKLTDANRLFVYTQLSFCEVEDSEKDNFLSQASELGLVENVSQNQHDQLANARIFPALSGCIGLQIEAGNLFVENRDDVIASEFGPLGDGSISCTNLTAASIEIYWEPSFVSGTDYRVIVNGEFHSQPLIGRNGTRTTLNDLGPGNHEIEVQAIRNSTGEFFASARAVCSHSEGQELNFAGLAVRTPRQTSAIYTRLNVLESITFSWERVPGATRYNVYDGGELIATRPGNTGSHQIFDASNASYDLQVTAIDSQNNETQPSETLSIRPSNAIAGQTFTSNSAFGNILSSQTADAVESLTVEAIPGGNRLRWSEANNATRYLIFRNFRFLTERQAGASLGGFINDFSDQASGATYSVIAVGVNGGYDENYPSVLAEGVSAQDNGPQATEFLVNRQYTEAGSNGAVFLYLGGTNICRKTQNINEVIPINDISTLTDLSGKAASEIEPCEIPE